MILFTKRSKAAAPIGVTIKGTGGEKVCYAIINGTRYTSAATGIVVMPGDTILFGIRGYALELLGFYGYVKIDGTEVLKQTTGNFATYEWNVPGDITSIAIELYIGGSNAFGQITVITS